MKELILSFFGYFFLWLATLLFRDEKSRIELFSKRWFVILFLTSIGIIFLNIK